MTTEIRVGKPDTSEVRCGTLWMTSLRNVVLVLTPLTEDVFNIVFWPEAEEMGGPNTVVSMIAADVLVFDSEMIASPLPALVQQIEETFSLSRHGIGSVKAEQAIP